MSKETVVLSNINHTEGFCWNAMVATHPSEGNTNENPRGSCWQLYEDAVPLRAHAFYPDIVDVGKGRYSHSVGSVYFSTTDNTSPLENGRTYTMTRIGRATKGVRRHSLKALSISLPKLLVNRISIAKNANSNECPADFWNFYKQSVAARDIAPNGMLLPSILHQWFEREQFRKFIDQWESPSVEIAVAEGTTSTLELNYPFDLGTEVFFSILENAFSKKTIRHQRIARFNINAPVDLGLFKTVVMIHSIDDYSEPDPSIALKTLKDLTLPEGKIYISGYTDYYLQLCLEHKPENQSFFEFRGLHPENFISYDILSAEAQKIGLKVDYYSEYLRGQSVVKWYVYEDIMSKYFYVNRLRKYRPEFITKRLASLAIQEEGQGGRGMNFFAVLSNA